MYSGQGSMIAKDATCASAAVVELNNRAAHLVCCHPDRKLVSNDKKQFEEAVLLLKKAARLFGDLLGSVTIEPPGADNDDNGANAVQIRPVPLSPRGGALMIQAEEDADLGIAVYDRYLLLVGPDGHDNVGDSGCDISSSHKIMERVSSAILFNLGLLHHSMACQCLGGPKDNASTNYFGLALEFYHMASSVIFGCTYSLDGWTKVHDADLFSDEVDVLLNLAIVSNKGHIHWTCFRNGYESHLCGNILYSILDGFASVFLPPSSSLAGSSSSNADVSSAALPLIDADSVRCFCRCVTIVIQSSPSSKHCEQSLSSLQ